MGEIIDLKSFNEPLSWLEHACRKPEQVNLTYLLFYRDQLRVKDWCRKNHCENNVQV